MIGCVNEKCKKWLHEECIKHDILTKVYEELGTDKPHKAAGADVKEVKDEEVKRPLSPVEPGSGTVATALPIQVKTDGQDKSDSKPTKDSVDVKEERDGAGEGSSAQAQKSSSAVVKEETRKPGRGRKKAQEDPNSKPYLGLFDAVFRPDSDKFEVTDLRDVEGGDKTWLQEAHCLCCGTRLD